jgi:hypothetical protein
MQWDPFYQLRADLPTPVEAIALFERITNKYPPMKSPTDSVTDQAMGLNGAGVHVHAEEDRGAEQQI